MQSRFRRQFFTLVTLTVATLVVLKMGEPGAQEPPLSQVNSCRHNCQNLGTILEMYATDNHGQFPRSLSQVLSPTWPKQPQCPAAGQDTYSASYQVSPGLDAYTIACKGRNHGAAGLGEDSPRYNSAGEFDQASSALLAPAKPAPGAWEPKTQEEIERTVLACECYGNTRIIAQQLKAYAGGHRGRFPGRLGELVPAYLKRIPTCPGAQKDTYSLSYAASPKRDDYAFCCKGTNHPVPFLGADRPRMAPGTPRQDDGLEECLRLAQLLNVAIWRNQGLMVK
jgi:hypothetical protein